MSNGYRTFSLLVLIAFLAAPQPFALAAKKRSGAHKKQKIFMPREKGPRGALSHPGFSKGKTSIEFIDIKSGKEIFAHNADLSLVPASCAKIVTAATALDLLGPEHKFETHFYSGEPLHAGTINTLFVKGTGDPTLVNEDIETIANALWRKGVRRISSGIVIDDSFFDSGDYPRKDTGEGRAYTAKTSAVAVNFNSAEIEVGPGKKSGAPGFAAVNPPSDYFQIKSKLVTGRRFRIGINLVDAPGGETILVSGTIPLRSGNQKFYRSIENPALHAGATIRYFLEQKGIKIGGKVREGKVPQTAKEILRFESKPLSEIVMEMNKRSNNFIAEQILKHVGAVKFGPPASTAKGSKAAAEYMASIGIPKGEVILENGSGLSDNSVISAKNLVKILVAVQKNKKYAKEFFDSLSVFGVDGTTKKWRSAPDLLGKAFVKTGTIGGVSSLAGYLPMAGGNMAAFAIIINGLPRGAAGAHEAEINLLRQIAEALR